MRVRGDWRNHPPADWRHHRRYRLADCPVARTHRFRCRRFRGRPCRAACRFPHRRASPQDASRGRRAAVPDGSCLRHRADRYRESILPSRPASGREVFRDACRRDRGGLHRHPTCPPFPPASPAALPHWAAKAATCSACRRRAVGNWGPAPSPCHQQGATFPRRGWAVTFAACSAAACWACSGVTSAERWGAACSACSAATSAGPVVGHRPHRLGPSRGVGHHRHHARGRPPHRPATR